VTMFKKLKLKTMPTKQKKETSEMPKINYINIEWFHNFMPLKIPIKIRYFLTLHISVLKQGTSF